MLARGNSPAVADLHRIGNRTLSRLLFRHNEWLRDLLDEQAGRLADVATEPVESVRACHAKRLGELSAEIGWVRHQAAALEGEVARRSSEPFWADPFDDGDDVFAATSLHEIPSHALTKLLVNYSDLAPPPRLFHVRYGWVPEADEARRELIRRERAPADHPDHDRPALTADAFDPTLAAVRALALVWFRAIRDRDLDAALIERDAFAWSLGAAVQRAVDDEWVRTGREADLIAGATAGGPA